jgi:hypothetical protein
MHWTTRYGDKSRRPTHWHLDDDGKECGCYSDDSSDAWGGYRHRSRIICGTHKRRQKRADKLRLRRCAVEKYNHDTKSRLEELADFMSGVIRKYYDDLKRKIQDIEDDMVPIKYLREYNSSYVTYKKWFNVQKIRNRYYCCMNKIKYHMEWKNKMGKGMKRKRARFILNKGWTKDDMTTRDYEWIKRNDGPWLKEYKKQIRMEQILKDEADWEVKKLLSM